MSLHPMYESHFYLIILTITMPISYCYFLLLGVGRENDRVYVLRYLQGTQKLMFWFQGKNDDDDDVVVMYDVCMYDDFDAVCKYLNIHP